MEQEAAVAELTKINHAIATAEKDKDASVLQKILADDLRFRRANGTIVDKEQFLKDLTNTEYLEIEGIEVSLAGSTAVVSLIVHLSENRDKDSYRNIRVFRKQAETWELTMWVNTPIALPG